MRALADPERLAIAGALARAAATTDELATTIGLPVKRLRSHLTRLAGAGVIEHDQDRRT